MECVIVLILIDIIIVIFDEIRIKYINWIESGVIVLVIMLYNFYN